MSVRPDEAYRQTLQRVKGLGRYWKRMHLVNGVLQWLTRSALILIALILLDRLLPIEGLPWFGLVFAAFLGILWFAYRDLFRVLLSDTSLAGVASQIERAYPGSENRILSAIELWPEAPRAQYGYSQNFVRELVLQAHAVATSLIPRSVFAPEHVLLRHRMRWAVPSAGVCLALFLLFPASVLHMRTALNTFSTLPAQMTGPIFGEITPGSVEITSNADVTMRARISGFIDTPPSLQATWNAGQEGAERVRSYPMNEPEAGVYEGTLHHITESLNYAVLVGDRRSDSYRITVRRVPAVENLQITLQLPEYTGLAPQALEQGVGNIETLVGSHVTIEVGSSSLLSQAQLRFTSGRELELAVTEQAAEGKFEIHSNDGYTIRLRDTGNTQNPDPVQYTIRAIEDEYPTVEILEPGRDVVLDERMMVHVNLLAQDDYGVERAELVYTHEGTGETARIPFELEMHGPVVTHHYDWDIDQLSLFPEDVVSYYVEVWDNDRISGPKTGRSAIYQIRHPSLAELYDDVGNQQAEEQGVMEELLGAQHEAYNEIDDVIDELRKSQELSWKEEKTVEQAIQTQEQIKEKAQELVQELQKTAEEMQQKQLFEPETIQKYQELQKLMNEALTEEYQEILEKLRKALENQPISEQEQALLAANFKQDEFRQRLERMVDLFKQMLAQQKLEAVAKQAKEFYEQQKSMTEEIQQQSEAASPSEQQMNENARREERLSEQLDALEEEIGAVADEIRQLPNQERIADEIGRLQQESENRDTTGKMSEAGTQLRQQQPEQALQPAQQATSALNDLQQGLDNAVEFMQGANAEQALAQMQDAVREGLQLSAQHEQVLQQSRELARSGSSEFLKGELRRIQELSARQLSIAQGVGLLAERLWEQGKEQMLIDPKIVWTLRAAEDELSRSARALEDRNPNNALPMQHQALGDINHSIRELLKAMDQMNQQMSMGGLDNMMEQLQQLAENQSQLNEMAQRLGEQMRQQGQVPGVQEMMQRMAYEQSLIRQATERLAENMERFNQTLGDLQQVSEDMKEVEQQLEQGNLNEEVLQKQRQILTRMLESAKSLQKRQTSKKRKSETAKTVEPVRTPPPLDPGLETIQKQLEANTRSGSLEQWPEAYRTQIRDYYRALSGQVKQ